LPPKSPALMVQGLVLALLVGGCVPAPPPLRTEMTAQEALTAVNPLIDCEWKAAARYDDGKQSVAALAERIMGICGPEIIRSRLAFLPIHDPSLDLDEFKHVVKIVEDARKKKANP